MRTCDHCEADLSNEDHRWELVEEWQICIQRENDCPEVEISIAYGIGEYCSEEHAMDVIDSYLSERNAEPTWADVDPVETCACCGEDFSTAERHLTLTMMELCGPEEAQNIYDAFYVARFCRTCEPPEGRDLFSENDSTPVEIIKPKWVGKEHPA